MILFGGSRSDWRLATGGYDVRSAGGRVRGPGRGTGGSCAGRIEGILCVWPCSLRRQGVWCGETRQSAAGDRSLAVIG